MASARLSKPAIVSPMDVCSAVDRIFSDLHLVHGAAGAQRMSVRISATDWVEGNEFGIATIGVGAMCSYDDVNTIVLAGTELERTVEPLRRPAPAPGSSRGRGPR